MGGGDGENTSVSDRDKILSKVKDFHLSVCIVCSKCMFNVCANSVGFIF